jgi:HD-GYP domain-containing protein (c-di-GMP phosphodiesterase class II)
LAEERSTRISFSIFFKPYEGDMLKQKRTAEYFQFRRKDSLAWEEKERDFRQDYANTPFSYDMENHDMANVVREDYPDRAEFNLDIQPGKSVRPGSRVLLFHKENVQGEAAPKPKPAITAQPKVSLFEEIPFALRAYEQAVACIRQMMAHASLDRMMTGQVIQAVDDIVASLENNSDALLCLPRLRPFGSYTYAHSVNVCVLMAAFAQSTGRSRSEITTAALAGLFHDLGKAKLPISILNSQRQLTDTEEILIMRHPLLGCGLLASLPDMPNEVMMAALEHHERYDGSGYPKGSSASDISEVGHLTAIADAYDAISSQRPYKDALLPHKTLGVMFKQREKHFHPVLLDKFVRMVGIYPVGSVVELQDGYWGIVTGNSFSSPMLPVVTLFMDPDGRSMPQHEFDLAKEKVAKIARCVPAEAVGIDPCRVLHLPL